MDQILSEAMQAELRLWGLVRDAVRLDHSRRAFYRRMAAKSLLRMDRLKDLRVKVRQLG